MLTLLKATILRYARYFQYLRSVLYTETQLSAIKQGPPLRENFDESYARQYFELRLSGRKGFIEDLQREFDLKTINFCSIGCGFGGEEYLLQGKVKNLVLIEPDHDTFSFLEKKFDHNKTILVNKYLEDYETDMVFNIIYTSGPSQWMHSSPWLGVPDAFIRFINKNLSADGLFIVRIYGGLHQDSVVQSKVYLKYLIQFLADKGLKVISFIGGGWNTFNLLIICKEGAQLRASNMPFTESGVVLIRDGVPSLNPNKMNFKEKVARVIMIFTYLPIRLLLNRELNPIKVTHQMRINLKLLQD